MIKHQDKDAERLKQIENNALTTLMDPSLEPTERKSAFLTLEYLKSPQIDEAFKQIATSPQEPALLKNVAIWALGNHKNASNLSLLMDIFNKNGENPLEEENFRLKEMALYSISNYKEEGQYLTSKAYKYLENVKTSNPIFSELAKELLWRNKELANKEQDTWIKEELYPTCTQSTVPQSYMSEKSHYTSLRDKYLPDYTSFEKDSQYFADKTLLPFRKILESVVDKGSDLKIADYVTTDISLEERGRRNPCGFFRDTAGGSAFMDTGKVIFPHKVLESVTELNSVFAHEWGHVIEGYINNLIKNDDPLPKDLSFLKEEESFYSYVDKLFEKAKGSYLDSYAAMSGREYFAQGNEAYMSIYKPHDKVFYTDDYENSRTNTRTYLKYKDPELYTLIDTIHKAFNKQFIIPQTTKPLNLSA